MNKVKAELLELETLAKDETLKEVTVWDINSVYELVKIAEKVLKAEILAHEGDLKASIILLKDAIEMEDALNYNEPPDWFFSIRHHLGRIYMLNGQQKAAI